MRIIIMEPKPKLVGSNSVNKGLAALSKPFVLYFILIIVVRMRRRFSRLKILRG